MKYDLGNIARQTIAGAAATRAANSRSIQYALPMVQNGLIAPGSVNSNAIPSGSYALGFPTATTPGTYHGPYAGAGPVGGMLPQVSTSSTDFNVCETAYLRSSGFTGTSDGPPDSSSGSGSQQPVTPPYTIGPDWIAVQNSHNGQIMGWMAPGETYQQFFSGASGHLLPGANNQAEAQYILNNQLAGLGSGPDMFGGM